MPGNSFELKGSAELGQIAARLREAGDKKLLNKVRTSMRQAAKPIGGKVVAKASESYPHKGGLSARIAARKYGIRSNLTGKTAEVWIAYKPGGKGLTALERGNLRHPVFGNKKTWVSQRVPAGRISAALSDEMPEFQRAVLEAANQTLDDVARGI